LPPKNPQQSDAFSLPIRAIGRLETSEHRLEIPEIYQVEQDQKARMGLTRAGFFACGA